MHRRPSKRPRLSPVDTESNTSHAACFLDLHAEVDHGDVESGDETDGTERDFIDSDLDDSHGDQRFYHSGLDRRSYQQEHDELERIAEHLKEAHRLPSMDLVSVDDSNQRTHAVFQPIIESDISRLWKVSVKRGLEAESLSFLRHKSKEANREGAAWTIGAAFARPSIPGVIYVKCEDPAEIRRVLKQGNAIRTTATITLVPPNEHAHLIKMPTVKNPIAEGDWVRIKHGAYKGDVGYVNLAGDKIEVLVVPRVYYQLGEGPASTRPLPTLFNADLARVVFGPEKVVQLGDGVLMFKGQRFKDGLLVCTYTRRALQVTDVRPTLEEMELFGESPGWDRRARDKWNADVAAAALRVDDRVEITEGEFQGCLGIIAGRDDDKVEVQLFADGSHSFDDHFRLKLPTADVRKYFKIGDYIHVRCGIHTGKYGYVVKPPIDGTLEFVEWDKSVPNTLTYEPDPKEHLAVYTYCIDFAEEATCHSSCPDEIDSHHVSTATRMRVDPMAGTKVVVVKCRHFRGYRGTIQYTQKTLKFFGVRLDATGKIVQLPEDFLVDMSNCQPLHYFRRRRINLAQLRLRPSEITQPTPPSTQTPMWESPEDSTTAAWDPSSRSPETVERSSPSPPWQPPERWTSSLVPAPDWAAIAATCTLRETHENNTVPLQNPSPQKDGNGSKENRVRLPPGLDEDWLASDQLHGKSIKVRILGFKPESDGSKARRRIPVGSIAYTTGKPVSGEPPELEIEVKATIAGTEPMSIPLRFLQPMQPRGVKEVAVVVAGEHLGKEVIVQGATGSLWMLHVLDGSGSLIDVSPDYLVLRSRIK